MKDVKIFLSAGIPTPDKVGFYGTTNDAAIAGAVMAFTRVCAEYNIPFYFGGQPTITPLVWSVAKDYNSYFERLLTIYQSRKWEDKTPKEVVYFRKIVWTQAGVDRDSSLLTMRTKMFEDNETPLAVFIGGADGVVAEYEMLKKISPQTRIIAFDSVGGGSSLVFNMEGITDRFLKDNFAYYQIFRRLLKDYRKE